MSAIEQELATLRQSEIALLKKQAEEREQEGRDLLAELATAVREQIRRAERNTRRSPRRLAYSDGGSEAKLTLRGGDSSLTLARARSSLAARGRHDAAALAAQSHPEPAVPFSEIERLAAQGNADTQFELGVMCEEIEVLRGDAEAFRKAADWYRQAADQGHADAQFRLGVLLEKGRRGVQQDYDEAVRLFRKAAESFRTAAEQGDAAAQSNLGLMYDVGKGLTQDRDAAGRSYRKSADWYRKAAEQGDANAQWKLGSMYEEGQGVPQDYAEAVCWYRKAAERGEAIAQELGGMYWLGKGVAQDRDEAARWCRNC